MNKQDDYLWDGSGSVDPEVARLEKLLSPLAHDRPLDELRLQRGRRGPRAGGIVAIVAALVAVAAAAALFVYLRTPGAAPCHGTSGFSFTAQPGGTVACGGAEIASGVLPIGGVLDTGNHTAVLAIANIGTADLGAGTRVRLEGTTTTRHQLFLERGRMHAFVNAPPRLFAVSTPSTQVIDLGCEYTIDVDVRGAGSIEVQQGKVELETGTGTIVVAPAGTHARLLPGRKASLPIVEEADPNLVAAVVAFEHGEPGSIERLLAVATPRDAITIANMYVVVPPAARKAVLDRLSEFVLPPGTLTVEDAVSSPAKFEPWREDVVITHLGDRALRDITKDQRKP